MAVAQSGRHPESLDQVNAGTGKGKGAAAHRHRDVQSARADRDLADAAAGRRVAVGAQKRRARLAETLQMNLVADPVPRSRIYDAEAGRRALQIQVIIAVLETDLLRVVVNVYKGQIRLYLG